MNTNLEQAIQQAMTELDKQASEAVPVDKTATEKLQKPLKKKQKK